MSRQEDTSKLWGGRFSEPTDSFVQRFTASVNFDQRMAPEDIRGSLAHAEMLSAVGVLSEQELDEIRRGLAQIKQEIEDGSFNWSIELEDVHMNIEARLTELIGVSGKKLHTGRSRNDQCATDIRLYLLQHVAQVQRGVGVGQGTGNQNFARGGDSHVDCGSVCWKKGRYYSVFAAAFHPPMTVCRRRC